MFKKIDDLSKPTLLSKTGIKDLRNALTNQYPLMTRLVDDIFDKKAVVSSYKIKSEYKTDIIYVDKEILFVQKENIVYPHLKLLHKYPELLPKQKIDIGGLKHIFTGSDVMAPGLTSPGGLLVEAKSQEVVGIYVEGKEHALAIGIMIMDSNDIRTLNHGKAIQNIHHLGDALWNLKL